MIKALCHGLTLAFGLGFNTWINRRGAHTHGLVAWWVVIGVATVLGLATPAVGLRIEASAATLGTRYLGVPVIGWLVLREYLVHFAIAGLPMVIGSYLRHLGASLQQD